MKNKKFTFNCPHCGQPLKAEQDWVGLGRESICCGNTFIPQPRTNSYSKNSFWGKIMLKRMFGIIALASIISIAPSMVSAQSSSDSRERPPRRERRARREPSTREPLTSESSTSEPLTSEPSTSEVREIASPIVKRDSTYQAIETESPTQPESSQQSGKIPKLYRFDYRGITYTAMEVIGSGYYCILSAKKNSTPFHWSERELEEIFQNDPRYCAKRPFFQETGWHLQTIPDRFEYRGKTHNMVAIPGTDYFSVWTKGEMPHYWDKDRLDRAKKDYSYRAIETTPPTQAEVSKQSSYAYSSESVFQKISYEGKIYNMIAIPGSEYYCVWIEGKQPSAWSKLRLDSTKREDSSFRVIETEPSTQPETLRQFGKVPKLYRFDYEGVPYNAMEIIGTGYYCIIPAKEDPRPFYWSEKKLEEIFQNDSRYCEKRPIFQEAEWLYQISKDLEIAQLAKNFPKRFKFGKETFTAHEIPQSGYLCICPDEGEPFIWTTMQMMKTENKPIYRPMLPVHPETTQQRAKFPERYKYNGMIYNAYEVPGTDYYCVWIEDDKPTVMPNSKMAQIKRDPSYSAGEIRKEVLKR